ncbi:MAG: hypothetical protein ACRDUY_09260 [Nitriliruptorales bacterium]
MNEKLLRVVVAAPLDGARAALRRLVEGQWGWEVVAEAADGLAAVRAARTNRADVLLADGSLEGPGIAGIREILPGDSPILVVGLVDRPTDLATSQGISILKGVPGDRVRRVVLEALEARWSRPTEPEVIS